MNSPSKPILELNWSGSSLAYMGPGSGLTGIGCLIGLLLGSWYTIKVFLDLAFERWLKKRDKHEEQSEKKDTSNHTEEESDASAEKLEE